MGPTPKCHFVLGFPSGSPEIPTTGTPMTLGAHNFVCKPLIEMRSKASYSSCRKLSNNMLHFTCTQGNRGDSWLLVVGSQFDNLIIGPSFGLNFFFRWPNGLCKPILDICVPRAFQWSKEPCNPLSFDPCNRSLKIQESIETPTPKVKAPLGAWGFILSHFPSLVGFPFGPQPCKPLPWSWAQVRVVTSHPFTCNMMVKV